LYRKSKYDFLSFCPLFQKKSTAGLAWQRIRI